MLTIHSAAQAIRDSRDIIERRKMNDLKNIETAHLALLVECIREGRYVKDAFATTIPNVVTFEGKQFLDILSGKLQLQDREVVDTVYDWFCRVFSPVVEKRKK